MLTYCPCMHASLWVWHQLSQLNHQWNNNNASAWNHLNPLFISGQGRQNTVHTHIHTWIHTRPQYAKLSCAGLRKRGVLLWILIWAWQRELCVSPHNLRVRGRGGHFICTGHTYTSENTHLKTHWHTQGHKQRNDAHTSSDTNTHTHLKS